MVLAVWMVKGVEVKTVGSNLLNHVSRILEDVPELGRRRGIAGKAAATTHYGDGLSHESIFRWLEVAHGGNRSRGQERNGSCQSGRWWMTQVVMDVVSGPMQSLD